MIKESYNCCLDKMFEIYEILASNQESNYWVIYEEDYQSDSDDAAWNDYVLNDMDVYSADRMYKILNSLIHRRIDRLHLLKKMLKNKRNLNLEDLCKEVFKPSRINYILTNYDV